MEAAIEAMKPLLRSGVKLVIVSGTTIENIAHGKIEALFTKEELSNLYLGLGRGAYNYAFDKKEKPLYSVMRFRINRSLWIFIESVLMYI